jgi:hypothetical protein
MLGALATAVIFVLLLYLVFEPRWETNDDVGMSMVAHGYGISAISSPKLIFSNVLWGYLVRAIPEVNGTHGYSLATLGVLITVGAVVLSVLYRLGAGYVASLSMLALILVRPVLFPQFTINAGLLLVAAIICWHLFARQNDWQLLLVGCLLAFFGYLGRSQEFLLVLIVALPLLPWRTLLRRRSSQAALLALVSAIAVSTVIDHQSYQGEEWKVFKALNRVRAPFTDFGAGKHLKQRSDILDRHGYSANDVDLIGSWFFVDPEIANPESLRAMVAELGPLPHQRNALTKGWIAVQTLWHPKLLLLVLVALLLFSIRPRWQLAASWALCIAAVVVLGLLGRPGILRVYVPLVSLLLVAPLLVGQVSIWRNRLGTSALILAAVLNTFYVMSASKASQVTADYIRKGLVNFPNDPVVTWGGVFPFEAVYPVLGTSSSAMSYRFYALGVFTLAPFSVAFAEQQVGRGMTDLLVQKTGILVIANEQRFGYLETYCKERLHGQIKELSAQQHGAIVVSRRRCEIAP